MFYVLPPGRQLGLHANTVEEVQFVIEGTGALHLEDRSESIRDGDLLFLREGERHDIENTGTGDLRIVAFFPEPEVDHHWAEVEGQSARKKVTTTRNR